MRRQGDSRDDEVTRDSNIEETKKNVQKIINEKDSKINQLQSTIDQIQTDRDYYKNEYNRLREQCSKNADLNNVRNRQKNRTLFVIWINAPLNFGRRNYGIKCVNCDISSLRKSMRFWSCKEKRRIFAERNSNWNCDCNQRDRIAGARAILVANVGLSAIALVRLPDRHPLAIPRFGRFFQISLHPIRFESLFPFFTINKSCFFSTPES